VPSSAIDSAAQSRKKKFWRPDPSRTRSEGRTEPARVLLVPIYGRFTEGFDTADLRAANALLSSVG
jgi:hypothetical protein